MSDGRRKTALSPCWQDWQHITVSWQPRDREVIIIILLLIMMLVIILIKFWPKKDAPGVECRQIQQQYVPKSVAVWLAACIVETKLVLFSINSWWCWQKALCKEGGKRRLRNHVQGARNLTHGVDKDTWHGRLSRFGLFKQGVANPLLRKSYVFLIEGRQSDVSSKPCNSRMISTCKMALSRYADVLLLPHHGSILIWIQLTWKQDLVGRCH